MSFAERFTFFREEMCGYSRELFAAEIGVSPKTVERWESRKKENIPKGDLLLAIAKQFKDTRVSFNWLISGEGEPYPGARQRRPDMCSPVPSNFERRPGFSPPALKREALAMDGGPLYLNLSKEGSSSYDTGAPEDGGASGPAEMPEIYGKRLDISSDEAALGLFQQRESIADLMVEDYGYLNEIYEYKDPEIITSIHSNLKTFTRTIRREKEAAALKKQVGKLEGKTAQMQNEIETLKRKLDEVLEMTREKKTPEPPSIKYGTP